MSELRRDPLSGRWVIISQERSARPSDFKTETSIVEHSFCPFCEGHEDRTPQEITAFRDANSKPDTKGWKVRVIPNKFPVMENSKDVRRYGIGMYDAMSGTGAHEVVVEHPDHLSCMADFSVEHIQDILKIFKIRLIDLYQDNRLRYVLVFKNHGITAGASLSHSHSQIIAMPIVPQNIKVELEAARTHYLRKERCLFCDVIKQEFMARDRIVSENEHYMAFAPYASRFPFEVNITPKQHSFRFTDEGDESLMLLAKMLKDVLLRLKVALNDPAYNLILHTAPNLVARPGNNDYWSSIELDYHWYIEIMPRLTKVAGFEWGTGFYINPTPPEDAAGFLREYEKYMAD